VGLLTVPHVTAHPSMATSLTHHNREISTPPIPHRSIVLFACTL